MPASVLLALLAATSLLALTPALVRRYDPDERMIADRAASNARVLAREAHDPGRPAPTPCPVSPIRVKKSPRIQPSPPGRPDGSGAAAVAASRYGWKPTSR
ncbi:hypothetical protein GCM10029992_01300 [Glycomyces albus]